MIKMSLKLKGQDKQQMDGIASNFIKQLAGTDAEVLRLSKTSVEIKALLRNLPVQMSVQDAEQLKSLLHQMAATSPGPATLALEIIDAAILLR